MKGWVILLAATLFASAAHADQQCALHQLGSLEITDHSGIRTVPVTINGKQEAMAIEPSNPDSFLTVKFGKTADLGISSGTERKGGGGHLFISRDMHYLVPEFVIGNTRATGLPFLRREKAPETFSEDIVGGLGADIFSRFDIEVDIKNGRVVLFSGDHCPGRVVYWTKSAYAALPLDMDALGHSSVWMKLDGKTVSVAFTFSTAGARMSMKAAKRIFDLDENSNGMTRASGTPANKILYNFPFKTLLVDGIAISNPKIDIDPALVDCRPPHCFGGSNVYLGTDELKYLHLFFAYSEGKLYATSADAH